jgi:hypothetical protein
MSLGRFLINVIFSDTRSSSQEGTRRSSRNTKSAEKTVLVKHQGKYRKFRINRYGEIFEEKG